MQTEGQIASPTRTGREEQLQFLRFWAFFNVFVCHGEQWLFFRYPTSHCSTAAVSFFFMLSGLVTALASFNKDIRLSWREEGKYLWRKVKKIYPLYLFTTLYLFLYTNTESLAALFDVHRFPGQLVRNLLLVQSWSAEGALSYNGVGWFLSTLMFLSVFNLPVMFLLNKINRRPKGWLLLSGALAGTLFLTAVYCYLTKNLDRLLAVHFPACQNGRIPQRNAAWNAGQHPEAAPEAGEYGADSVHGTGSWRARLLVFHAFPRRKSMEKQNFHMAPAKFGADRRVYLRYGLGIQPVPLETAGVLGRHFL